MYGTTHAHLVHMCWPLLWGLEMPLQSPPPPGDRHLATVSPPHPGDRHLATVSPPHPGDRRALTREFARGVKSTNGAKPLVAGVKQAPALHKLRLDLDGNNAGPVMPNPSLCL